MRLRNSKSLYTPASLLVLALHTLLLVTQNHWTLSSITLVNAAVHVPGIGNLVNKLNIKRNKQQYTPLVFFKVPAGLSPICDAMEDCVRQIENELNVRVERLDVLRDPAAEATLALLTKRNPPFLYHRESCQTIHVPTERDSNNNNKDSDSSSSINFIDKDRVRAWAKGRYLMASRFSSSSSATKVKTPILLNQNDKGIDQDELLEDLSLTPLQKKGMDAMKERTENMAREKAEKNKKR